MHIQGFDSIDEAYAAMATAEDAANQGLTPPQIALRDDDAHTRHFVVALPDCLGFGEVPSRQALLARIAGNFDDLDDPEQRAEYEYECETYGPDLRQRGYLTGTVHTAFGSESGDTHVSQAIPITEAAFEEARRAGWKAVALDRLMTIMLDPDQVEDLTAKGKITPTLNHELAAYFGDELAYISEDERDHIETLPGGIGENYDRKDDDDESEED